MFFLGMPSFMESVFNVMMSFSKEKFKQRIQLLGKNDFSKLHEELGTDVLPKGTFINHANQNGPYKVQNRTYILSKVNQKVTINGPILN